MIKVKGCEVFIYYPSLNIHEEIFAVDGIFEYLDLKTEEGFKDFYNSVKHSTKQIDVQIRIPQRLIERTLYGGEIALAFIKSMNH
jgi:hypothetical protein